MNISGGSKITFVELFRKSWAILTENLFSIIMVCLIVGIPANILNYFLIKFEERSSVKFIFDILQFLLTLAAGISSLAIVYIAENSYNGKPPMTLWQSMWLAYKRWGSLFTASFLMSAIVFALLLLLIIPGLIWMIYYTFLYQIIALTDLKWKKALDYSKYIVRGSFWRVIGYMLAFSLVPGFIYFIIYKYYKHLVMINPELTYLMIPTHVLSYILFAIITVAATVLYLNLSSIKDTSGNERTTYEKINAYVNRNSLVVAEDTEDIENLEDTEESEVMDSDDDSPRCSTCGIKVETDQVVCPMCHTVIR